MINHEAYGKIFGNSVIKDAFFGFTERNAFPHAIILSGPEGCGKTTFALLFAASLACREKSRPCLKCERCRKIFEGICPDVTVIENEKDRRSIGIDTVRGIKEGAYIRPSELEVKVYVIKNADTMTEQAQNALLKLFEEPPQGVYFVLLCKNPSGLLSTVRSRAPELRPELFSEKRLTSLLVDSNRSARALYESSRADFSRILHISGGSYGKALSLIEKSGKKVFSGLDRATEVCKTLANGSKAELLLLLQSCAKDGREPLSELLANMIYAFRDAVAVKKSRGECELLFFSDREAASALSSGFTLKGLLDTVELLQDSRIELAETNINLQLAASVLAVRLWDIKQK